MDHRLIVVGASTGGVDALQKLVAPLPEDFDAALLIVLHSAAESPGYMAQILNRAGDIPASYPDDGERIAPRRIYLARPDYHLLVDGNQLRIVRGPKENRHRPAIDPLFRSAAVHHGRRVIGVILTGNLNDGTSGLIAVKDAGGVAVVQDPNDAVAPSMPRSAAQHTNVDYCVPLAEIAPLLVNLVSASAGEGEATTAISEELKIEAQVPAMQCQEIQVADRLGTRSTLTCPDCGGAIWEVHDQRLLRFRCHQGHAFTAEHLSEEQDEAVEKALWVAIKTFEESGALAFQMAARAAKRGDEFAQRLLDARGENASRQAATLRSMLQTGLLRTANSSG